jgi:response regulator RpfG family c-di-GMP phosphodiesterase
MKSLIKQTTFKSNDIFFNVSIGFIHVNEVKEYDMLFTMAESDMYADKSLNKSKNNKRILEEMIQNLKGSHPQLFSPYMEKVILYIGNELKILPEELDAIIMASRFKDIGILANDELLDHSKCCPEKSFLILKSLDIPFNVANTVLHHKENYDGSGFPQGIKGDDIPYSARVLSIAQLICESIDNMESELLIKNLIYQNNNQYDNMMLSVLNTPQTSHFIRELIGD